MSMIRFLPSFARDTVRRAVSRRTLRLETLESRLQLSAVPPELAFELLPQEEVAVVQDEQVGADVGDSVPSQTAIGVVSTDATSEYNANQVAANSQVCLPLDPASVTARIDALMTELAQRDQALRSVLDRIGPSLPLVAAQNMASLVSLAGDDGADVDVPSDTETSEGQDGLPTADDSTTPTTLGEGELTSEPIGAPPAPGDPSGNPPPPGGPGGPGGIGGPQLTLPVIVEFGVIAGLSNIWTAQGLVEHAQPWTLTVVFGGLFEGHSTSVNSNGSFSYPLMLSAGISGLVSAQAFDQYGEGSNIEFDYIT